MEKNNQQEQLTRYRDFRPTGLDARGLGLEDHPDLASTLTGLGETLVALGRAGEAEAAIHEALAIRRAALSAGHWRTAETRSVLGACLAAQGRFAEAEPLLLEGHAGLEEKRGADYYLTRAARARLVALYEAWRRPGKAAAWR